jgi:hypothetical protein
MSETKCPKCSNIVDPEILLQCNNCETVFCLSYCKNQQNTLEPRKPNETCPECKSTDTKSITDKQ